MFSPNDEFDLDSDVIVEKLHVYVIPRGRSHITMIQNLTKDEMKELLPLLKRELHCGGSLVKDPLRINERVIHLSGDQREGVMSHLLKIRSECDIVVHGA